MNSVSGGGAGARALDCISACSPDLLAYFERRTASADAADLLSETILTAWRRIDDLPKDDIEARMWLFGVARRILANAERASVRRWKLAERLRSHLATHPQTHDDAQASDVRDAVRRLPDDLRDLIGLVHWEGFTLEEAARIIGIPASTARGGIGMRGAGSLTCCCRPRLPAQRPRSPRVAEPACLLSR
ncbi:MULTISPECIES: RNA polymerase sigma factor [unclassified Microbacterium]|uniref:RNA polymerase sigma factor n=1 Tax=unclassified Microbacterium TaxID=2609290 RepID=UPI00191F164B|nr:MULTISPECIES: sigma-70 family RNA polymerase sigma factor [unclassified Microbacterium]QYM63676.1 sigma-70 family RNA polymerase sigma factor [Microbacterium sp. Se5.02b]